LQVLVPTLATVLIRPWVFLPYDFALAALTEFLSDNLPKYLDIAHLPWPLAEIATQSTPLSQAIVINTMDILVSAIALIVILVTLRFLQRRQTRKALERQSAAMSSSIDGMAILDQDGKFTYLNEALAKAYGYDSPDELIGKSWTTLYDEQQLKWFDQHLASALERDGFWRGEATGKRRDGSVFPQELSIAKTNGNERVCVVRDTTERKALESQLKHQAFHDSLSNLPNRALFMNRLEHALARSVRGGNQLAVLFLDLDNFKVINDSLGHEVGDQLLIAVGSRLKKGLRPGDTLARVGGDEFTVLLEDVADVSDAMRVAERITEILRAPFMVADHEIFVGTSIGIALNTAETSTPSDLVREADMAMYKAKVGGKARYEIFDPSMHAYALQRLRLQNDLHRAIERRELRVHYQPKVRFGSETVEGMEALVRWDHPERGLLSPDRFISLAEETGLIVPIGRLVLEEACNQLREWQEQNPNLKRLKISVNLSAKQLQQAQLIKAVAQVLRATRLDPASLILEITESALMVDEASTRATLQGLKNLGVELAMDDFGTGYSSLSFLRHFPVDIIKIDKSFIREMAQDASEAAIVSGIIDLAHALRLQVVAEGIETPEQLRQLKALGCDIGQGFYFGRPLPSNEARDVYLRNAPFLYHPLLRKRRRKRGESSL
jgi:diguanylate cyclase (GGDEF)-like protein/PAS domain S-box-containing protein